MILDIKINLLEIRVIWQICYNNVAIQNTPIHAGIQPNYQIKSSHWKPDYFTGCLRKSSDKFAILSNCLLLCFTQQRATYMKVLHNLMDKF